jgi:hypothetical protein
VPFCLLVGWSFITCGLIAWLLQVARPAGAALAVAAVVLANRAATIGNGGRPVAVLIHGPALRQNPELVDSVWLRRG